LTIYASERMQRARAGGLPRVHSATFQTPVIVNRFDQEVLASAPRLALMGCLSKKFR
jgi:hypothetical protein